MYYELRRGYYACSYNFNAHDTLHCLNETKPIALTNQ